MQQRYPEIRQMGGEVGVVSFSPPHRVAAYVQRYPLPFPVFSDPERKAYAAFQLGRGSWWKLFGPGTIARYVRLMLRGWLPNQPTQGDDMAQLGGDFVLDAKRRVVWAYPSRTPTDRPSGEAIVAAVRQAVGNRPADDRRPDVQPRG